MIIIMPNKQINEVEEQMELKDVLGSVADKLKQFAGVETVFGKAQQINDLTVIPVARVAFGMGSGGAFGDGKTAGKGLTINIGKKGKAGKSAQSEDNAVASAETASSSEQFSPETASEQEPVADAAASAPEQSSAEAAQGKEQAGSGFAGGGGGGGETKPLGIFVFDKHDKVRFYPVISLRELGLGLLLLALTYRFLFKRKKART